MLGATAAPLEVNCTRHLLSGFRFGGGSSAQWPAQGSRFLDSSSASSSGSSSRVVVVVVAVARGAAVAAVAAAAAAAAAAGVPAKALIMA